MITDKICVQQIFGGLIKNPSFLDEVDQYNLSITDFNTKFEKLVFATIFNLHKSGANTITLLDIDNYINFDATAREIFKANSGLQYLEDAIDFSAVENFSYYYGRLKKINLVRDLKKQGFDIKNIYCEDLLNPNAEKINSNFDSLSNADIVTMVKKKLLKLESEYAQPANVKTQTAVTGIRELVSSFGNKEAIGIPIQGHIYNEVINGAEAGCLTICSAASGVGKTRRAVADACYLAYPIRFNSKKNKWEQEGNNQKVLFIITEQTYEQIQKMILAYLTDINESRFKYNIFSDTERAVIEQALNVMEEYEDNFIITKMPDPSIELTKAKIREECLLKNIQHVFYDYIFISNALLTEFRGSNLRNDELLLLYSTALKDLAVELQVSMFTATQVNAAADDNRNIRNESSLAGGRATINKADNGAIMARPTREELEALAPLTSTYGLPNIVTDIFKVRSGQWTQVRIWSYMDLGTLKRQDLFITNSRLEPVENFVDSGSFYLRCWSLEEQNKILKRIEALNNGLPENN